jgi:protein-S-isoprenylcysteine O-methyltransferase Ste14
MRTRAAWLIVVPFLALARPSTVLLAVGGVLTVLGLALRAWSAGTIDKGRSLAVRGPYAYTRNPLYLGSFALGTGLALSGGHWMWPVAFAFFFASVYGRTMRRETAELTALFGDRYTEYAAHVPAFLPRLTPYKPETDESAGFAWSRYLGYREWEALLGVAAAFAVLSLRLR